MAVSQLSFFLLLRITLLEAIHATRSINKLLLPRVKGVALGANLHVQFLHGTSRGELMATTALYVTLVVLGVDAFLHVYWGF